MATRSFLPGARHLQTGSGVRIALLSGATTGEGRQCTGQMLQSPGRLDIRLLPYRAGLPRDRCQHFLTGLCLGSI
ncbi:hypothetical protein [Streptomyces viridosporus]|uniref:hypothetical protein n=1 Tax=Streptomyces viridosporus TaxID=67581 RepID=UPI003327F1DA